MKGYHNKFISQLKEQDFKQMQTFARGDEFKSIKNYVAEKLKKTRFTPEQQTEIENFFANAFNKVSIVSGTGLGNKDQVSVFSLK
jgi:hypothetical protein